LNLNAAGHGEIIAQIPSPTSPLSLDWLNVLIWVPPSPLAAELAFIAKIVPFEILEGQ
jgi:hypothetical protein